MGNQRIHVLLKSIDDLNSFEPKIQSVRDVAVKISSSHQKREEGERQKKRRWNYATAERNKAIKWMGYEKNIWIKLEMASEYVLLKLPVTMIFFSLSHSELFYLHVDAGAFVGMIHSLLLSKQ